MNQKSLFADLKKKQPISKGEDIKPMSEYVKDHDNIIAVRDLPELIVLRNVLVPFTITSPPNVYSISSTY